MSTIAKDPELLPDGHASEPGGVPPGAGKPKLRGLIWIVFLLIIAGITGYAVWRARGLTSTPAGQGGGFGGGRGGGTGPVPVVVTKVTRSSIPVVLKGLGNVSPFYTVTVKSRVDGQLMKVEFNEGDQVHEGQTLIEIDPRPYQVQLDSAEAARDHDQALLDNSRVDLDRYQQLMQQNAIPKQQLDTQVSLVAQYVAMVKQDVANIENAKLQLTYAKITAPITGVVGLRLVDPGNIVHASDSTGMITITQLQPIAVLFTIPEDDLPAVIQKLRAGVQLPAEAYNRDDSKQLASGKVVTLDNEIDNTTGTSKLKAVFENTDNALYPQQFVNIRVLVDTLGNQLVVPNVAVQDGQQGKFVYVVDDDSLVHLKVVQIGNTTATSTQILAGLSDGDRVVVDGTDRLVDGGEVRVRKAGEMENPPGYDAGRGGKKGGRSGKKGGRGGKGDAKSGQRGGGSQ